MIERLRREPHRFGLFQAVLLLERRARAQAADDARPTRPVGREHPPDREFVRFRAANTLGFPPSEVAQLRMPDAPDRPPELGVHAFGLTGPAGVLPYHYTAHILRRVRARDVALRDFLDLFNHRLTSLFFRAWEKYRLPPSYERSRAEPGADDPTTRALFSLVGLGTPGLRGRLDVHDEAFLRYAGHFARHPRSAAALEDLLADYFDMPIRVRQGVGQWLRLDPDDQSRLPGPGRTGGHNRLGVDALAGARAWDAQGRFRVRVGPIGVAQFRRLVPGGDALRPLGQLARAYAGPEYEIDIQPVLKGPEVPWCRPGDRGPDAPRLGWNTWVRRAPFADDVAGPVFSLRPGEEAHKIAEDRTDFAARSTHAVVAR